MKRCIKWFAQRFRMMIWQEKVGVALGGLLGITIGIIIFVLYDFIFWLEALFLALLVGGYTYAFGAYLFTMLAFWIEGLFESIRSKHDES